MIIMILTKSFSHQLVELYYERLIVEDPTTKFFWGQGVIPEIIYWVSMFGGILFGGFLLVILILDKEWRDHLLFISSDLYNKH